MKFVLVQFEDEADLSVIPKGSTVAISNVATSVSVEDDGIIMGLADVVESEPVLVPHGHAVTGLAGEPIPS